MRQIILTCEHKAFIKSAALQSPEIEVCGVITSDRPIALTNTSPEPWRSFELDPDEWEAISDRAIAIYHSHCAKDMPGHLSLVDVENSNLFRLPYVLYHPRLDCWDYFDPLHTNPYPLRVRHTEKEIDYYLRWQFDWGRSDCAALVRGFFEGYLDLPIQGFTRVEFERLDGAVTFTSALEGAGFMDVTSEVSEVGLRLYDVPLMSLRSPHLGEHIGIITQLQPCRMLHHVGGDRLSELVRYGRHWQERTLKVFRHKSLSAE